MEEGPLLNPSRTRCPLVWCLTARRTCTQLEGVLEGLDYDGEDYAVIRAVTSVKQSTVRQFMRSCLAAFARAKKRKSFRRKDPKRGCRQRTLKSAEDFKSSFFVSPGMLIHNDAGNENRATFYPLHHPQWRVVYLRS